MNKCEELSFLKDTKGLSAIVMDIQPKLTANIKDEKLKSLLESLELLIDTMTCFSIPIAFTEQVPEKLGATLIPLSSKLSDSKMIHKNSFSAFGDDIFCKWVECNEFNHLLLSGIETSICVYLTAIDALRRGIGVTILSDCVFSRREQDGIVALKEVSKAGASILSLESVLYSLLGSSEHPAFKKVSNLVKSRSK